MQMPSDTAADVFFATINRNHMNAWERSLYDHHLRQAGYQQRRRKKKRK